MDKGKRCRSFLGNLYDPEYIKDGSIEEKTENNEYFHDASASQIFDRFLIDFCAKRIIKPIDCLTARNP